MSLEPLWGLHVLVVDDDATARGIVAAVLAHGGALVTEAPSSDAAWSSLARLVPEVIVCALELEDSVGSNDLLQRIRTMPSPSGQAIPIVAIARGRAPAPMNEVLGAGFAGYIKTPVDPRQLWELIADVADARPQNDGRADEH
jgi:CheY-like chemotaxis protein